MKTALQGIILATKVFVFSVVYIGMASGADDWRPARNVEIVAGSSPGGALDRTAREVQSAIQSQKLVENPVVVINRPGAGSAIAWDYVSRRTGDGSVLGVTVLGLLTNRITGASALSFQDLTPIAVLSSEYVVFAVPSTSSIGSGQDLITVLRKDPAKLNIGIATALGGASHIAVAQSMKAAGVDIEKLAFIVYPSSSDAVTALLGKHIDMVAASAGNFLPAMQTDRIRTLAVTSPQRLPGLFKNTPTWREQGVNIVFASWRGIAGPKDMPRESVKYWDDIFRKIVASDDWKRSLERNHEQDNYMASDEARRFLSEQDRELTSVLVQLGLAKK